MDALAAHAPRLWPYLQLLRPANIVTALADILAGFAASVAVLGLSDQVSVIEPSLLAWLLLSTAGLYGGGVVFNDVFDTELDARERPERPLPSGRATRDKAVLLGGLLLLCGVFAAMQVSWLSAVLAATIALAVLIYDGYAKHHTWLGPLNMGACRGANLLLGISAMPAMVANLWWLALIPMTYIAAITAISRGEVHGGRRRTGALALGLIALVIAALLVLGLLPGYSALTALPFIGLLAWLIIPAFIKAARAPRPLLIRAAVKAGVLALIVLDAALAAGFAGLFYGMLVLLLLPVSMGLARLFAVT